MEQKAVVVCGQDEPWKQLRKMLERIGVEAVVEPSCKRGHKVIEHDPDIDVVIIDHAAADNCGITFLDKIRRSPRLGRIPVLVGGRSFNESLVAEYTERG